MSNDLLFSRSHLSNWGALKMVYENSTRVQPGDKIMYDIWDRAGFEPAFLFIED
ncbi:hypothetical protein [Marinilabilia sp.]|uniref:hypothetical protein n=1 Tax=Marinilabilia sp. TaxID=2021252 RepID=UPI0025B85F93|nr:hypothetical protein [Marinilabilia sp.]